MYAMLVAATLALLATSSGSAPVSSSHPSPTTLPVVAAPVAPTVSAPDASWLTQQIQDRVERHRQLTEQLGARALAGTLEERNQIQLQLDEAFTALRVDILRLQLDHAGSSGNTQLVARIESNIERLIRVSQEPDITLRAEKLTRPLGPPAETVPVEPSLGNRDGFQQGGGK